MPDVSRSVRTGVTVLVAAERAYCLSDACGRRRRAVVGAVNMAAICGCLMTATCMENEFEQTLQSFLRVSLEAHVGAMIWFERKHRATDLQEPP